VLKHLWDMYGLDEFFSRFRNKRRKFDISKVVFYMACKHILEPQSKLGMYESYAKYINFFELDLNHLYRALDDLAEIKEDIEEYLFERNRTLFNMTVDVVFYDVTTFYFESKDEDLLRKFGYSKDGKASEVQVVLGLLIDAEGKPIGYDIFSGNIFEGKSPSWSTPQLILFTSAAYNLCTQLLYL